MSILAKKIKTEKRKKQKPNENQKNDKYESVSRRRPGFYIWLARGAARPPASVSYATAVYCFSVAENNL